MDTTLTLGRTPSACHDNQDFGPHPNLITDTDMTGANRQVTQVMTSELRKKTYHETMHIHNPQSSAVFNLQPSFVHMTEEWTTPSHYDMRANYNKRESECMRKKDASVDLKQTFGTNAFRAWIGQVWLDHPRVLEMATSKKPLECRIQLETLRRTKNDVGDLTVAMNRRVERLVAALNAFKVDFRAGNEIDQWGIRFRDEVEKFKSACLDNALPAWIGCTYMKEAKESMVNRLFPHPSDLVEGTMQGVQVIHRKCYDPSASTSGFLNEHELEVLNENCLDIFVSQDLWLDMTQELSNTLCQVARNVINGPKPSSSSVPQPVDVGTLLAREQALVCVGYYLGGGQERNIDFIKKFQYHVASGAASRSNLYGKQPHGDQDVDNAPVRMAPAPLAPIATAILRDGARAGTILDETTIAMPTAKEELASSRLTNQSSISPANQHFTWL